MLEPEGTLVINRSCCLFYGGEQGRKVIYTVTRGIRTRAVLESLAAIPSSMLPLLGLVCFYSNFLGIGSKIFLYLDLVDLALASVDVTP